MNHRRMATGLLLAILTAAAALPVGCVRRTVTIRTEPEGARILLNDEEIGTSPVTVDFTWYGDYDVACRKDGYETLRTHHKLDAPWYQLPGIDFFAEVLYPFTIHDHREMSFQLEPAKEVDRKELIDRAREFRDRAIFTQ
ncbi:MAG TPA: PEGA domain-containing protein [Phycisphaerae bacterium]|nr:PEGA domain-containing protein [Phycisphaerae bacterium]